MRALSHRLSLFVPSGCLAFGQAPRLCGLLLGLAVASGLSTAAAQTPVISEFVALNSNGLRDEDGDESDWIELHLPAGAPALDLGGWSLTDDAANPTKWMFQGGTLLQPGGFRIVFASDKDRRNPAGTLHTNFRLSGNGEALLLVAPSGTVVHGYAPQYPPQYQDVSYGLQFNPSVTTNQRYFAAPTPGAANVGGGPPAYDVRHTPSVPTDLQDLVVTAAIPPQPAGPPTATLTYRVNYGTAQSVSLRDDGVTPDVSAGDGVYSARIPATASTPGQMIRYKVTVADSLGTTTLPPFLDPLGSPEWFGTVVLDSTLGLNPLPVWQWFVQNPNAATTESGTRCSVFIEGRFYDNVRVARRGGSSATYPRKSFKFDFNPGDRLELAALGGIPVDEANINTHYADKAHLRQALSYQLYTETGSPTLVAFPLRLQQNGIFYSVQTFIEEPDRFHLQRIGLDAEGALYKMYNELTSATSGVEKVTRETENNADLAALVAALAAGGPAMEPYLFDNIDIPKVLSYLVATWVMHDNDHVHKNYLLYRDTNGDREWHFVPWDKDLTWGRNYYISGGVLNDTVVTNNPTYSHVLMGDRLHPKVDGFWNRLIDRVYENPRLRAMYLRRLRAVCDEYLQPDSTPLGERWVETQVAGYVSRMAADVALDAQRWGVPNWGVPYTFLQDKDRLLNLYMTGRRAYFYGPSQAASGGLVPEAEPRRTALRFSASDVSPQSGNQDEEFLELTNDAPWAADLSGYTLSGGVEFTFPAGAVVEAGGRIFVAPSVTAFRARTTAPRGGQGHFVIGPYEGRLEPGQRVLLRDRDGLVRARLAL